MPDPLDKRLTQLDPRGALTYDDLAYLVQNVDSSPTSVSAKLSGLLPDPRTVYAVSAAAKSPRADSLCGRRRRKVPCPSKPSYSIAAFAGSVSSLMDMDSAGLLLLGQSASTLWLSDDYGATWSSIRAGFTALHAARWLANGEIIAADRSATDVGSLLLSSGYPTLGPSATWSTVLTAPETDAYFTNYWGLSTYGAYVFASEYGSLDPPTARRVYASTDYGATWSTVLTATQVTGQHLHSHCYDPFWDAIWAVFGDGAEANLRVCLNWRDATPTWTVVRGPDFPQPTSCFALPDCLLISSDSTPNGVYRIWKLARGEIGDYEVAYYQDHETTTNAVGRLIHRKSLSDPVLLCSTRGPEPLKATFDGIDFFSLYREAPIDADDGLYNALGPAANGNIYGTCVVNAVNKQLTMTAPTWIDVQESAPVVRCGTYLWHDPAQAGGCYAAHQANQYVAGDLDLRVKVLFEAWPPVSTNMLIAKDENTTGTKAWKFYFSGATLVFTASADGSAIAVTATWPGTSFAINAPIWLRCAYDASVWQVDFYYSLDDQATWTLIGTKTGAGPITTFDAPAVLSIGGYGGTTGGGSKFKGRIYAAEVRDGIAGTVIARANFEGPEAELGAQSNSANHYTIADSYGNDWTLWHPGAFIRGQLEVTAPYGLRLPIVTGATDTAKLASLLEALSLAGLIDDQTT